MKEENPLVSEYFELTDRSMFKIEFTDRSIGFYPQMEFITWDDKGATSRLSFSDFPSSKLFRDFADLIDKSYEKAKVIKTKMAHDDFINRCAGSKNPDYTGNSILIVGKMIVEIGDNGSVDEDYLKSHSNWSTEFFYKTLLIMQQRELITFDDIADGFTLTTKGQELYNVMKPLES